MPFKKFRGWPLKVEEDKTMAPLKVILEENLLHTAMFVKDADSGEFCEGDVIIDCFILSCLWYFMLSALELLG
jgi:hypothetical protein